MATVDRTILKPNNMEAYSQAVDGFDIRPRILGCGPTLVIQDCFDLDGVVLRFTRYRGHMLEQYASDPNWLTIAFLLKPIRWCGHVLPALTAITLLPSRKGIASMGGVFDLMEFSYSKGALSEVGLEGLVDEMDSRKLSYGPVDTQSLAWAHRLVGQIALNTLEVRERLLDYVSDWISFFPRPDQVVIGGSRLEVAQAVIDMIDANSDRFLTMDEISSELGVTERWVRESFKSTTGINVNQYARQTKLDLANQMLRSQTHSVTSVATNLGFNHLGRFSEYYRARFAELPARTLRES